MDSMKGVINKLENMAFNRGTFRAMGFGAMNWWLRLNRRIEIIKKDDFRWNPSFENVAKHMLWFV